MARNYDYLTNLITEWGISKTIQITMFSLAGACLISAMCVRLIPDKPGNLKSNLLKENKYHEDEYYDRYN